MKRGLSIFVGSLVSLQACQTATPVPESQTQTQTQTQSHAQVSHYSGNTGNSVDDAVVIDATSDRLAAQTEEEWIRHNYPGAERKKQSLTSHGQHVYDVVQLQLIDGSTQRYYFDISKSFMK